jgi:hypothetical protein
MLKTGNPYEISTSTAMINPSIPATEQEFTFASKSAPF